MRKVYADGTKFSKLRCAVAQPVAPERLAHLRTDTLKEILLYEGRDGDDR